MRESDITLKMQKESEGLKKSERIRETAQESERIRKSTLSPSNRSELKRIRNNWKEFTRLLENEQNLKKSGRVREFERIRKDTKESGQIFRRSKRIRKTRIEPDIPSYSERIRMNLREFGRIREFTGESESPKIIINRKDLRKFNKIEKLQKNM